MLLSMVRLISLLIELPANCFYEKSDSSKAVDPIVEV